MVKRPQRLQINIELQSPDSKKHNDRGYVRERERERERERVEFNCILTTQLGGDWAAWLPGTC